MDGHQKRRWLLLAAGGLALAGGSCSSGGNDPVGRLHVAPAEMRLGFPDSVPLRLTFEPLRPLDKVEGAPTVFVHLLHPTERRVVQTFDHRLPDPWVPGTPQSYKVDIYQSALAEPLPPGPYRISIGLYDETYGYRWPLHTGGAEADTREYVVATVDVPKVGGAHPSFEFAGEWGALERPAEEQIPGRRCLEGPASLRVKDPPGIGTVRLLIRAPAAPAGNASLRIAGTCDSDVKALKAGGTTWLNFPVTADAVEEGCHILLAPDPDLAPPCLDGLAWSAATPGS